MSEKKVNIVNAMTERALTREFGGAESLLMVTFGGLDVASTSKIRGDVAEKGARLRMVRNRLARRVLAERGFEFPDEAFEGNVAIAYGDAEAVVGAAKALSDKDVKKSQKVRFTGGVMQGQILDAASAAQLADLPDRETVRAMMLGVISAPARGLATILNAVPSATVRVIQARVDKEGGAEG